MNGELTIRDDLTIRAWDENADIVTIYGPDREVLLRIDADGNWFVANPDEAAKVFARAVVDLLRGVGVIRQASA